jgi:hypothetical protein
MHSFRTCRKLLCPLIYAQDFSFSLCAVTTLQIEHYTLGLHKHNFIDQAKKKKVTETALQHKVLCDNTSHEGRLFPPLPAVVGWVAVVAGVCAFGGIFEPRALEPGGG